MVPGADRVPEQAPQPYDALIFFTYLYAPTVLGLEIDPARSILVPTAHDEPAIHLGIYREMFAKPAAVAFNTEVEKNFLKTTFEFRAAAEETVGCGVDLLQDERAQPDEPSRKDEERLHKRLPHAPARPRARSSAAATGCRASSCSTAAASTPARAARS